MLPSIEYHTSQLEIVYSKLLLLDLCVSTNVFTRYLNYPLTVLSTNFQCKIPPAYSAKCSGQILIGGVAITVQPPIKHICQTPITAIRILYIVVLNAAQSVKRQAQLDTKTPPIRCNWKPG